MRDSYYSLENICSTYFNLNEREMEGYDHFVLTEVRGKMLTHESKQRSAKPLLQNVNNLYPAHAPFEHSTR